MRPIYSISPFHSHIGISFGNASTLPFFILWDEIAVLFDIVFICLIQLDALDASLLILLPLEPFPLHILQQTFLLILSLKYFQIANILLVSTEHESELDTSIRSTDRCHIFPPSVKHVLPCTSFP